MLTCTKTNVEFSRVVLWEEVEVQGKGTCAMSFVFIGSSPIGLCSQLMKFKTLATSFQIG